MWIDSDTMIINPTFQLPLNKFAGKDLVIWGNETALLAGDGKSGVYSFLRACRLVCCSLAILSLMPPGTCTMLKMSCWKQLSW